MNDTALTADEWERLRELSLGPMRFPLPEDVGNKFVSLGFAEHSKHGYSATPLGEAAVARHFTGHG